MVHVLRLVLLECTLEQVNTPASPVPLLQGSIVQVVRAGQRSSRHVLADTHAMAVQAPHPDISVLLVQSRVCSARFELVLLAIVIWFQCNIRRSSEIMGLTQ